MAQSRIQWKVQQLKADGMSIEEIKDFASKQIGIADRADTSSFWSNVHNNVHIHFN